MAAMSMNNFVKTLLFAADQVTITCIVVADYLTVKLGHLLRQDRIHVVSRLLLSHVQASCEW